jgi:hypothetical protein
MTPRVAWYPWARAKKLSQNCGTPALGRANGPKSTAEGGCATSEGCSEIVSKEATGKREKEEEKQEK